MVLLIDNLKIEGKVGRRRPDIKRKQQIQSGFSNGSFMRWKADSEWIRKEFECR